MYSISNDASSQWDEIKYKYSDTIKIITSCVVGILKLLAFLTYIQNNWNVINLHTRVYLIACQSTCTIVLDGASFP